MHESVCLSFDRFCPAPGIVSFRRILSNGFLRSGFENGRLEAHFMFVEQHWHYRGDDLKRVSMFGWTVTRRTKDMQRPSYRLCCTTACRNTHFPYHFSLWNPSQYDFDVLCIPFTSFPMLSHVLKFVLSCQRFFHQVVSGLCFVARSGIWSRKRKWLVSRSFVGFRVTRLTLWSNHFWEKKHLTRWLAPGTNDGFVCMKMFFFV